MPSFLHTCYRIGEIDRSVAFYEKLGFAEARRMPIGDEAINVFMALEDGDPILELTYNHGVDEYDHGTAGDTVVWERGAWKNSMPRSTRSSSWPWKVSATTLAMESPRHSSRVTPALGAGKLSTAERTRRCKSFRLDHATSMLGRPDNSCSRCRARCT